MPRWKNAASLALLLPLLAACAGGETRARILAAEVLRDPGAPQLELTQELRFSRSMREALAHGIPLRLAYHIRGCGSADVLHVIELRYLPLLRRYEMQRVGDNGPARHYARRSALLASLDRIRLPLGAEPPRQCVGSVSMALDLTALPTPLRFPALLRPREWRMIAQASAWPNPPPRA